MARTRTPTGDTPREKRAARRLTLILRAGKLACDAGQFLCVLRDASPGGVKARLFHALPDCDGYALELGSGERYPVERVWSRDGHAGFRFAEGPIDLAALIDETGPFPKRTIRLQLGSPVLVAAGDCSHPATLCDLSQHGAQVELDQRLALGQQVRLDGCGLPPLHGRVRWRRGAAHGLVFQESFRLDELAIIAARIQLGDDQTEPVKEPQNGAAVNQ